MAHKLFIDTWGWLTLRDRQELRHQAVVAVYRQLRAQGAIIYTTDYVLDETFTLLFKRVPGHQAQESMRLLMESAASGSLCWRGSHPSASRRHRHSAKNSTINQISRLPILHQWL
jgi:hypothetical protein